ncbi:hypothetical protein LHP98_12080 [Rhodobacter sp. Har01]|uniref:hypothetical protein n=1 Tax=Rhodobacter sp. Har01 TaxID=2883999 RepID=UPI001D0672F1|nr:hypothetical protein [Rhodobacter sp. Har01]MCB6178864.1 hypothetical protein [Rhodobacter sp. Har01]
MTSIVEQNLPSSLLRALGAYTQTCAHIELHTAVLILEIEKYHRVAPFTKDVSFPVLRKLTAGNLLKRLKRTLESCQPTPKHRFDELVGRLEEGKDGRDIAVHGAFYFDQAKQSFRVNFFKKVGDLLVEEQTEIDSALVVLHQVEADSIYVEILELIDLVRSGAA